MKPTDLNGDELNINQDLKTKIKLYKTSINTLFCTLGIIYSSIQIWVMVEKVPSINQDESYWINLISKVVELVLLLPFLALFVYSLKFQTEVSR